MGMSTAPKNLNPLGRADAYELEIIENIYGYGTTVHPTTYEFKPWSFKEWTLTPENVGTDKPTLVGELRDDLTFNNGKSVTAEDVKFTVEYAKEQGVTGVVAASNFDSVEAVSVDSPTGTTVNYFFSEKDNAWFTNVLGSIILPKHIWKDVADYTKYTPRKTKEGVVGSGPMALKDFNWGNWLELEMRPSEEVPYPRADYVDWLHQDAPFIDALRFELFGSQTAKEQAVLNGEITVSFGSFKIDRAVKAKQNNSLTVKQSPDDGWSHHSYNVRRVPLDDPAFRQLLVLVNDKDWIVNELYKGIGAVKGSYATLPVYEAWRPPEPTAAKEYKGIPLPDLTFPGTPGTYELGESGIRAAREFLMNHPRAKHSYSLGEAATDVTTAPDGQEIYVNGKPLSDAHTDNDGNAKQGPLETIHSPAKQAPKEVRLVEQWHTALKNLGVPVEKRPLGFDALTSEVLIKETFDLTSFGWTHTGPNNDHFKQRFGHWGADVEADDKTLKFNVMGYTGADDLIRQQATMFDPAARQDIVKQVLARIWADAPTDITHHSRVLQPVNTEFTGWIETLGGVTSLSSWLNLRKASQ